MKKSKTLLRTKIMHYCYGNILTTILKKQSKITKYKWVYIFWNAINPVINSRKTV